MSLPKFLEFKQKEGNKTMLVYKEGNSGLPFFLHTLLLSMMLGEYTTRTPPDTSTVIVTWLNSSARQQISNKTMFEEKQET